jgi:AcrR family transcriptional regulator
MPGERANRPRRQAKQRRSRATVDTILEAAARVLVKQGYAAASTNRVAEVAGVSIGTLYEYFANREEVYDALIEREIDALLLVFQDHDLGPGRTLIETLMGRVGAAMAALRFGPELTRALEQVPGALFRTRLATARGQVLAYLERLFEEHRSELQVRDLGLAAFVTLSAVEGIAANASNDRFDARLAEEIEVLLRSYLIGAEARAVEREWPL